MMVMIIMEGGVHKDVTHQERIFGQNNVALVWRFFLTKRSPVPVNQRSQSQLFCETFLTKYALFCEIVKFFGMARDYLIE